MDRYSQKKLVVYKGVFQPIVQPFVWTTHLQIQKNKEMKACFTCTIQEADSD
jgi:hypothetical protein